MGETTAAGTRCLRCSAAVRPDAPWCTQCYAPVGAATAAGPGARPAPVEVTGVAERVPGAAATQTSPGTWPCSACSRPNELALPVCVGCGTAFLADVRSDRPTVVLPVVGDLLALTPRRRVGTAVGAVLAFLLVASLLALLLA